MQELAPSIHDWENLYRAAIEFRQIEPWKWMDDSDLFGVQNPEDGEVGYCCVVGALGELLGLIVHLGTEGLKEYLKIQTGKSPSQGDDILYAQQALVASFENKKPLQKPDLEVVKRLGLKFRGARSWPFFRSYQPGYYPWYLIRKEILFLTLALQQSADVALRFRVNQDLFRPPAENHFFVRVAEQNGPHLNWRDEWLPPAPFKKQEFEIPIPDELRLQRIKRSALQKEGTWEVDFFHVPLPIEEGLRPFYPYVFLAVDRNDGLILATHLESPERYRREFQNQMLNLIEGLKCVPEGVTLNKEEVLRLFEPIASKMGFRLTTVKKFKELGKARRSMETALLSGKL